MHPPIFFPLFHDRKLEDSNRLEDKGYTQRKNMISIYDGSDPRITNWNTTNSTSLQDTNISKHTFPYLLTRDTSPAVATIRSIQISLKRRMFIFLIIESTIEKHLTREIGQLKLQLSTKIRHHLSHANTSYKIIPTVMSHTRHTRYRWF